MRALGGLLVALVLVACGGGTEASSSATNPERSESPTSTPPAPREAASPAPAPTEAAAAPPSPGLAATDPVGSPAPAAEPVHESLACATHADCVLLAGVCGGVEPTNRSHEAETREGIEMRRTVASCAAAPSREPRMVARCNAGACMAIEPP